MCAATPTVSCIELESGIHLQLMENLDFPQAVEEIKQAAKWLREQGAPKVRMTVSVVQAVCVASNCCKMSSIQLQQISQVGLHISDLPSHEGWYTQMTSARPNSLYLSCISGRNVAWEYCCSAVWAQTCALHSRDVRDAYGGFLEEAAV